MTGKVLRMRHIVHAETNRAVMFAFSHGTSAPDVLAGLENGDEMVRPARAKVGRPGSRGCDD
jgi:hypothetical protein